MTDIISKDKLKGLVFDIQGQSVHDGPGSRTTVFLNGCPLNCSWCANPEGLFSKQIMMHSSTRCKSCGNCIDTCPSNAVSLDASGQLVFDRKFCDVCTDMKCVSTCYHEGVSINGKEFTVQSLINRLERDSFYWGKGGGVTFSGGEPLLNTDFIVEVFKECKKRNWHVCVETTACISTERFKKSMQYVDWAFVDLKHMDSDIHKEYTGAGNSLIHENLSWLAEKGNWDGFCVIRIPIIPGINWDKENIQATAKFVKKVGLEVINILPFHRIGESKYTRLGRKYQFEDQLSPSESEMDRVKSVIEAEGLICFSGDDTPF